MGNLFAASPVDVIDSIVIAEESDISKVLAEWSAFDSGITVKNLTAAKAVKLVINWSYENSMKDLRQGDYFTFVIPDIFMYDLVNDVTDAAIKNDEGDIVATYSIYDNGSNMKELKMTFTDYVEDHTDISGNIWLLLFVGEVASTEHKNLEFIVNGNVAAQGEVTIIPHDPYIRAPHDEKTGYSYPPRIVNGYYVFEWIVYINMNENAANGFNTLKDFSFEDIIPSDSSHVFLTDAKKQELGLSSAAYASQIGEYIGADPYSPLNRYPIFKEHYNSTGTNIWYNYIKWNNMVNGLTTVGIDGNDGLAVSDITVTDKSFSAKLGTLTRPTAIRLFTISTVRLVESALGDSEVVKLFKNKFEGSFGQDLDSLLTVYRFESGGSAQGITGDYSFAFTKVNEKFSVLPGVMFSLYVSLDFSVGADRIVYSGNDGVVAFRNLPAGIFYVQETVAPSEYIPDDTIYKVVLNSEGFTIYYGATFENILSENQIVNRAKDVVKPVSVKLAGTKRLTGRVLSSGMFNFVVRDNAGRAAATGTNDANGGISFTAIEFDEPGVYTFTVEEVRGTYSAITYDTSKFIVTVTVTDDGKGSLTAEVYYPDIGVVFNNGYSVKPTQKCGCYARATKCRRSIEGRKIWIDNNNAEGKRPLYTEVILIRDDEVYLRAEVDSTGDGSYAFCCLPIWKNASHKYDYKIDETNVPDGYAKTIEGYNIINIFTP